MKIGLCDRDPVARDGRHIRHGAPEKLAPVLAWLENCDGTPLRLDAGRES